MQQAPPNTQWHHSSMDGPALQQQWNYGPAIPSIIPQPSAAPVARNQVPSRKPIGQILSMQPALAREDSTATISRRSVSSASGSISSLPSLSSSVASPVTRGTPAQPQNVQYLPPIVKQLPPGWRICNDSTGRTYFLNTVTNQSTWDPPESEVINPNYGFSPTFNTVTYAPVPAPQFHPAPQNPMLTKDTGAPFPHTGFNPQRIQFSPSTITPQQSQFSSTTTLPSQISTSFAPQPQQFPPATAFAPQSPATFEPQPRQIARISTFSSQPPSISPTNGIQWESCEPNYSSTRKKSRFSLPKGFNPPKINTSAIKIGAKKAGQTSLKGAKITGKALKNNRKVIGAGVKIANVVLRETTGVSIPGTGLIAGGGGDDDDDGVFAVVGAVGSMIGGGDGDDCNVDIDVDESCEVDVEVDEVSVDDDGNVDIDCEEVDLYENQEVVEYGIYQDQTTQPVMVQQTQSAGTPPQNRKRRPGKNPQRPGQADNHPKPAGQGAQNGKRPQKQHPNPNGAKPTKQRPSPSPLRQNNKPHPNSTPNAVPRKRQSHHPTKQTQTSQGQLPPTQKAKKPRPGGQAQQRPQTTAHVSCSNQNLGSGSSIANSVMRATVQEVSKTATRELSKGLMGLLMDDDFEAASDDYDYGDDIYDCSDGVEYEEEAGFYEEDAEYEEEYENDDVEVYEQQEETICEEQTTQIATANEAMTACNEETLSEFGFQVDYSTFEGYGGFYGDSTSFTVQEQAEPTAHEEVYETEITQVSETVQQDPVTEAAYTVETIDTSETFQREIHTEDIYTTQETQVSETFQQNTVNEEVYAAENVQGSEFVQQDIVVEGSTFVEVDQTTSQSAAENLQPNPEIVPVETLDSWNSASPPPPLPAPPLWAQENAMLEENVWATEPANVPPSERNVWSQTETCVTVNETTRQSSFQEEAIYTETSITQHNMVQQGSINEGATTYVESNVTVTEDYSREAVICIEATVVEPTISQGSNQNYASNDNNILENLIVRGGVPDQVGTETVVCEITNSTLVGPLREDTISTETNIRKETTILPSDQQRITNLDTTTYGEMVLIDCGMVQESHNEIPHTGSEAIAIEETRTRGEFIGADTVASVDINATTSGPLQDGYFYEETLIIQEARAQEVTPGKIPSVQTLVSGETTTGSLKTSQSPSEETSFIVESVLIEPDSFQAPPPASNVALTATSTTIEVNHAGPIIPEEPSNQSFCIETDVQLLEPLSSTFPARGCNHGSESREETRVTVHERPPQQRQGSGFSIETESISTNTQQESIHEEAFVIETASYVEMSPMIPNTIQHSIQVVTREPTPVPVESPQQTFVIEDATCMEGELIQPSVVELSSHNEVIDARSGREDNTDTTKSFSSQGGSLKEAMSIETISIVVSPPEETAERQSWINGNLPHTETCTTEKSAAELQSKCVEVALALETASPEENATSKAASPLQKSPPTAQAFAIDGGSNVVLQPVTTDNSPQELPISDQNTCPTPEEEMPYNSPLSNPHQDEHELFFNVPSKQPTDEREIVAQKRARKDTLANEQLKEFIQSQALIFQAASIIEETIPESESARSDQVNAEKPIPIPPPPPYPPPLRLPSRNSWAIPKPFPPPEIPLKTTPEAPHEIPEELSPEPAHESPEEPAAPPTKTLKTILSEAVTAAHATPASTSSQTPPLDQDVVFELPALNDAREEPNIIEMTAQEQFAMAMFASGDFLGDDLGFEEGTGRVVEEEGNMLPEVRVG